MTLTTWLNSVPLSPLVMLSGMLLSVVLCAPVGRLVGLHWFLVLGLGVSLSLVLAATITPAAAGEWGPCLRAMAAPLDPRELVGRSDRVLNTWLFVPLGLFAGYAGVRKWWVLVLAFCMPFAVEGVQRVLPALDRRCQFQDLIDNLWGLVLGSMIGVAAGLLAMALGAATRRSGPSVG